MLTTCGIHTRLCEQIPTVLHAGGTSGRVAELDSNLNLVAEHPRSEKNIDNFSECRVQQCWCVRCGVSLVCAALWAVASVAATYD